MASANRCDVTRSIILLDHDVTMTLVTFQDVSDSLRQLGLVVVTLTRGDAVVERLHQTVQLLVVHLQLLALAAQRLSLIPVT